MDIGNGPWQERTPKQKRNTVLYIVGKGFLTVLKGIVFVFGALIAAIFQLAKKSK